MHHYLQYSTKLMTDNLYIFVFIISILESIPILGTFSPGMVFMLFFGFTAFLNDIHLGYVILVGFLGAVIGDIVGYLIGKYAGGWMIKHKKLLKQAHIDIGRGFFSRHGGKSILIGRFIGIIRPIVPLIAGSIQMSFRKFIFWNILGAFLWVTFYMMIGYFFGQHTQFIVDIFSKIGWGMLIVIIPVGWFMYKRYRDKVVKM